MIKMRQHTQKGLKKSLTISIILVIILLAFYFLVRNVNVNNVANHVLVKEITIGDENGDK
ncbi:MAG: hypothetical protein QWI36_03270 [Wolbachia endosymbiont of Tyrophagus putrescentiae]|nr:hypothetical protein [Wolbachia endosymbiont of Tyrophagus putrescentiae]